jgi:hypothetical protein
MCKNNCKEYLHNECELPSIEPTIRYLHGKAGFPTKASWLKAICKGNYLSRPLINVNNVAKDFPESEETQKGHMCYQRQGVCSMRVAEPTKDEPANIFPTKKEQHSHHGTQGRIPHAYVCRSNRTFPGSIEPWQQVRHDLAPC